MDTNYLSYREAAQFIGVPVGTLYAWVSRGVIAHYRFGNRHVRLARADLQAFLDTHYVQPKKPSPPKIRRPMEDNL